MPYSSVTVAGVTLLCFPPEDAILTGLALREFGMLERPTPGALERALRSWYPALIVRRQHELAAFDEPSAANVWYVYRDGRFSPFSTDVRWWEEPGCARVVIADDGRYLDANEEALRMLNVRSMSCAIAVRAISPRDRPASTSDGSFSC